MKKVNVMKDMNIEKMEQVYYTKDYDKFKLMDENRKIRLTKSIKDSIIERGILEPITVDEYMNILDGQHRFTIAKELNAVVPFRVARNVKLVDILHTKSTTRNWGTKDYIEFHAKNNNEHFSKIIQLASVEKLTYRCLISLYHFGIYGEIASQTEKDIVVNGLLNMDINAKFAEDVLLKYNNIIKYMQNRPNSIMQRAIFTIMSHPEYNQDRMIKQVMKYSATILFNVKGLNKTQCCIKLRELYNYKQRDKILVFSEDLI